MACGLALTEAKKTSKASPNFKIAGWQSALRGQRLMLKLRRPIVLYREPHPSLRVSQPFGPLTPAHRQERNVRERYCFTGLARMEYNLRHLLTVLLGSRRGRNNEGAL